MKFLLYFVLVMFNIFDLFYIEKRRFDMMMIDYFLIFLFYEFYLCFEFVR